MKRTILLLLLWAVSSANAFTPNNHNKHGTTGDKTTTSGGAASTRPAFAKDSPSPAPLKKATPSGNTATFAFAPAATTAATTADATYYEDDEVVIGYATAIISCALSLALGFGLGYGT